MQHAWGLAEPMLTKEALSRETCELCCNIVEAFGGTEVIVFGSTLWKLRPRDLDLAVAGINSKQNGPLMRALENALGQEVQIVHYETLSPPLSTIVFKFGYCLHYNFSSLGFACTRVFPLTFFFLFFPFASKVVTSRAGITLMSYEKEQWRLEAAAKRGECVTVLDGGTPTTVWSVKQPLHPPYNSQFCPGIYKDAKLCADQSQLGATGPGCRTPTGVARFVQGSDLPRYLVISRRCFTCSPQS